MSDGDDVLGTCPDCGAQGMVAAGATVEHTPAPPTRSTYMLLSDFERLEEWCRLVRVVFPDDHGPFLVGSALQRHDYRDVDLRLIVADEDFDHDFSDPVRTRLVNRAISIWGQQETGLPIDFQIQRMTEANAEYSERRNPMGLRSWATTPTSGTPKPGVAKPKARRKRR